MSKMDLALVQGTDLFKHVSEGEFAKIFAANSHVKKYPKDAIIYLQDEKCENLDVVLKGTVTVQKIDFDGKMLTINTFKAGEVLGENLIFSVKNEYPMTVLAKEDCTILHIPKEMILALCQTNKDFLLSLLQSLSSKTLILSDKLKSSMKSIRQILIDFLLFEYHLQNSSKIKLTMTKKDLAEKFGMQRASLSRELNKMREDGLINFDARTITIIDIERLKN